jgi:polyisoprenoid-binding protein YceI
VCVIAALAAALGLLQQLPDSIVYVVSPESHLVAHVGRSGVLSFLGHDHLIEARAVSGRVVYRPATPAASHTEITVRVDGLAVLTPPDSAERRQVTEVMRTQVLAAGRYPELTFRSRDVATIVGGFRVRGALTIAGVSREVAVDVAATVLPDTLRVTGTFPVKQTSFGITPVRAGAGAVRVADGVTIDLAVVAVRGGPE